MIMNTINKAQEIERIVVNLEDIKNRINRLKDNEQQPLENDSEALSTIDIFEKMINEIGIIQSNLAMVRALTKLTQYKKHNNK